MGWALEHAVVVDDDARRFLPAVLQGEEGVICGGRDVLFLRCEDSEHTALFVKL